MNIYYETYDALNLRVGPLSTTATNLDEKFNYDKEKVK